MKIPNFLQFKRNPISEEKPFPSKSETSWSSDTFFGKNTKFEAYDPDQLRARKGNDIYQKMLRDPQVKSAFNLVVDIIISKKFRFEKPDDSELQKKIEEFFYFNIESSLRGEWKQAMRSIMMAKAYGFSVSEKIFCVDTFKGKEHWLLSGIKSKPYNTFVFIQDPYGNVVRLEQENGSGRVKLNKDKFIIHVMYPELDPIYGESDLRSAYRPFWEKDNILKMRNIYVEKMAGGFIVATPGENAASLSASESAQFLNSLKRVAAGTAMTMPQGWEAKIEQAVSTTVFDESIAHCDKQIAKSLLVPNLLGFSEQGASGSFAQSRTQSDTFSKVISSQSDQLADVLNEQLFRELAWWNFGVKEFPRFTFEDFNDEEKREIANSWITAVEKGVVINTFNDEQRTRDLLQYDTREEDEEPLINPNSGDEQTDDIDDETKEEPVEDTEMAATNVPFPSENTSRQSNGVNVTPSSVDLPENNQSNNEVDTRRWFDRMDFVEIEETFDTREDEFVSDMSEVIDIMVDEVEDSMKNVYSEFISGESKDEINMELLTTRLEGGITKSSKSDLNRTIKENLRKPYADGRKIAQETLNKSLDGNDSEMSQNIRMAFMTTKRLAVKHKKEQTWSVADFVDGLTLDSAEKYFSAKSFEITGNLTNLMLERARLILLNGIRDELSINQMVDELEDVLGTAGIIPVTGPDKQERLTRPRLETIARTNVSDAFNQAALNVYNDPDLGDFVEAFEYSAILDSRTTDFCRAYDGRVFLKDDTIWRSITPPNHFNCRSTLIPVTILDEFKESSKATTSNGQLVQPSDGFGTIQG